MVDWHGGSALQGAPAFAAACSHRLMENDDNQTAPCGSGTPPMHSKSVQGWACLAGCAISSATPSTICTTPISADVHTTRFRLCILIYSMHSTPPVSTPRLVESIANFRLSAYDSLLPSLDPIHRTSHWSSPQPSVFQDGPIQRKQHCAALATLWRYLRPPRYGCFLTLFQTPR
ncbi:hypothetical protein BC628DRAFT_269961 [Trametes gibbosa]|nr:hypothetical protein BC628DRAFT_269961 [Trametes gibbosa]